MNKTEFIDVIKKYIPISHTQIELIEKYKTILQTENKKYNLTRLDKEEIIYSHYFLESIFPYFKSQIEFNHKTILDIGSGSGIPGVLIKIFFPHAKVYLLESNSKKVNFLKLLCNELGLIDISIINDRAETYIQNNYEKFDIVTSRAVSELRKILELSAGYAKVNGLILEPKGINWNVEFENAKKIMDELDLSFSQNIEYQCNNKKQTLLVFKKNKETNRKYPRKWQAILNG